MSACRSAGRVWRRDREGAIHVCSGMLYPLFARPRNGGVAEERVGMSRAKSAGLGGGFAGSRGFGSAADGRPCLACN